jgi:hypothetical protein
MKKILGILFLAGHLPGFSQAPAPGILSDTSKVAILQIDSLKAFMLSTHDISVADSIFNKALEDKFPATKKDKRGKDRIGIKRYYIQLVPRLNAKGEKEVWINCFCHILGNVDWKKEMVDRDLIEDGGSCFFELTVNLSLLNYYGFVMNGMG